MLADSVEAATRASRDHSPEAIDALVEKIMLERLSEGQLDECDLTLRDLRRIKTSFLTLLIGMYHPRIEYPERRDALPSAGGSPSLGEPDANGARGDLPVAARR
jgi:membrane-associated HD superfamily phosphohydrolase